MKTVIFLLILTASVFQLNAISYEFHVDSMEAGITSFSASMDVSPLDETPEGPVRIHSFILEVEYFGNTYNWDENTFEASFEEAALGFAFDYGLNIADAHVWGGDNSGTVWAHHSISGYNPNVLDLFSFFDGLPVDFPFEYINVYGKWTRNVPDSAGTCGFLIIVLGVFAAMRTTKRFRDASLAN